MFETVIVENDPMAAQVLRQYISNDIRFRVAAMCKDAVSAQERLEELGGTDLIMLDIGLPGLDGLSLLRKLRAEGSRASVMVVTASASRDDVMEAIRLGSMDYILKPFSYERIKHALDGFVRHKSSMARLPMQLTQKQIDSLYSIINAGRKEGLPKGIKNETLDALCGYLKGKSSLELTSNDIAASIGLSLVTVRRYMEYLAQKELVEIRMNYVTGGRPRMIYKSRIK